MGYFDSLFGLQIIQMCEIALSPCYKTTQYPLCLGLILVGHFLDEKCDFQTANFQHFSIFAKIDDFSKKSQGYNFEVLCFWILAPSF